MANNWRQQAKKLLGQQIVVRDTNGKVHRGVLQSIRNEGIQIRPQGGAGFAAAKQKGAHIEQAIAANTESVAAEETFFFGWFLILWALIAGLWAASAWRGYGPYGYGGVYGRGVYPPAYRYGPPGRRYWW